MLIPSFVKRLYLGLQREIVTPVLCTTAACTLQLLSESKDLGERERQEKGGKGEGRRGVKEEGRGGEGREEGERER